MKHTTMDTPSASEIEYVDAHCHVDLFPKPAVIVEIAESKRIHTIAVTNAPFVYPHTATMAQGRRYLKPALGLHPELVATHGSQVSQIVESIRNVKFVGEVGLDYTTSDPTLRANQRKVFNEILEECASQGGKVLTVHSRKAGSDVIAAIGQGFPGKVILHWFTGSARELERALASSFYFSVNAAMLRSKSGRALVDAMPPDRVLTESDGPFVQSNGAPDSPSRVQDVVVLLAARWQISPDDAAKRVMRTFAGITGEP
jgi:TatD DNase family protein